MKSVILFIVTEILIINIDEYNGSFLCGGAVVASAPLPLPPTTHAWTNNIPSQFNMIWYWFVFGCFCCRRKWGSENIVDERCGKQHGHNHSFHFRSSLINILIIPWCWIKQKKCISVAFDVDWALSRSSSYFFNPALRLMKIEAMQ